MECVCSKVLHTLRKLFTRIELRDFCWYCYSCNHYLFSYVISKEVILCNALDMTKNIDMTKNNGCFKRCVTCKSLWLIYDNTNVMCCSNVL